MTENMNNGKSYTFFQYASNAWKWATHIGKTDLDTYPYFDKFVDSVSHHHDGDTCEEFLGHPNFCTTPGICPPANCGSPLDGDFMKYS
eukprot:CAMPEP_0168444680 /NCGR_PEP_ID=MMETSP0228-20121227/45174_1 /TAXON_ID=133427 /ORGANISM="Protoceratium reticulatum, Strain CCCM 535 (=CCMP 1889)" /LENGTH=87 /DNA_ID=CAMNT_0008459131 /DNA_START=39 /DNA_END=298 /DNA_ORIENTATION=+